MKVELDCATLGSVLPICLSLRPVGSIHISCLAARAQTSAAQIAEASPPYNMKYFLFIFWHYLSILFLIFLTEAAQYECSYRRTAHHATGVLLPNPAVSGQNWGLNLKCIFMHFQPRSLLSNDNGP